jgi:hypothetical protein
MKGRLRTTATVSGYARKVTRVSGNAQCRALMAGRGTTGSTKESTFPFLISLWERGIERDLPRRSQIPPHPPLLKGG